MERALEVLAEAPPDVFNHNLETVPRLYRKVRPGADYEWSLDLLQHVQGAAPTSRPSPASCSDSARRSSRSRPPCATACARARYDHDRPVPAADPHHPVVRYWTPTNSRRESTRTHRLQKRERSARGALVVPRRSAGRGSPPFGFGRLARRAGSRRCAGGSRGDRAPPSARGRRRRVLRPQHPHPPVLLHPSRFTPWHRRRGPRRSRRARRRGSHPRYPAPA